MKAMSMEGSSIFLSSLQQRWGFDFEHARGSFVSANDHGTTSKDYIKVEHVQMGLLIRNFRQLKL